MNERSIGRYDYEDGSYVQITARGDIDTEEALVMVETLIAIKRRELARRKIVVSNDAANINPAHTEEGAAAKGE